MIITLLPAVLTTVAVLTGMAAVGAPIGWPVATMGLLLGGLLVVRRRWPVGVLLVSAVVLLAFQGAGLFEGGWVWPLTVACYTVAASGRTRWAVGVGAVLLLYALAWDWAVTGGSPARVLAAGGAETLWLALVLAVGNARHLQARWRAQVEQASEAEARRRLAEQRLEISRELHDVVAHTLAVVGVHLNVAADALEEDPEETRAALRTAMEVRGKAMADLRSLIGVLRIDGDTAPVPDLDGIAALVAAARTTGLKVDLHEEGDPTAVPGPQAVATYRLVQEALTNTIKHAQATHVSIRLRSTSTTVIAEVTDDGRGAAAPAEGHGLTGMRERITLLGGTLSIDGSGGFTIRASIPLGA
ncbi:MULTISPECIES: sensor histidine kinase [Streptosporangium]|uniref:histidine kinase n=1 Tax=Streptosporangium brasiliense TaxID=47480 RepID=A0ABT9RGL7_9ACTN|nr:sensor histidine kinase [Streptosporangium brasiliense]MDP9868253.1 signal transduction histidine kinase [Streptosporangium brasiliense]